MPILRKTLDDLRRYHRLLVVGGRCAAAVVMVFALVSELVYLVDAHLADQRQAFTSAYRLVLGRFGAVEQAFLGGLARAEMAANDAGEVPPEQVARFRANGNLLRWRPFPSEPTEMLIAGAPQATLSDATLQRAFSFSTQIGRASAATARVLARPPTQIIFNVSRTVVAIVPATSVEHPEQLATDAGRATFVRELTEGAGSLAFDAPSHLLALVPKAWWVPRLYPLPNGRKVLQLASPVLLHGQVKAVLVNEVDPADLLWPIADGAHDGSFAIVGGDGRIVALSAGKHAEPQTADAISRWSRIRHTSGERLAEYRGDGRFVLGTPLGDTGFSLVYTYSWRDVVRAIASKALTATAIALAGFAFVWLLLSQLNRRVFQPMYARSEQVFDSERLSRTMIETVPVGIGLVSTGSGELLYGGSSLVALAELVEGGMPRLIDELKRLHARFASARHDSHDEVFQEDVLLRTRDGKDLVLQARFALGRYLGKDVLVTAFVDMTASQALQQQLRHAKLAADQANAAKSAFLAAMSHEIRTPLNAILGNLELLGHSALNPLQRDRLDTIRASSNGLLAIIQDVLDFSKIEAGEMRLEHMHFRLVDTITRSLAMFAPAAHLKRIALVGQFRAAIDQPMRGDPGRLAQVVNNLLSNAIKFTGQGRVTLSLDVERLPCARGGMLVIEVADTGIGIEAAHLSTLFNAFMQADSSISRRFGGTGLGLALCQRLVTQMGGTIDVQSEPGQGSRFTVRVPLDREDPAGMPLVQDVATLEGAPVILLAAEDDRHEGTANLIASWGATLQTARHPDRIDDASGRVLVICGERDNWSAASENRLVEDCEAVINCSEDGPLQPMRIGRVLTVSCHSPLGLRAALEHVVKGTPLITPDLMPATGTAPAATAAAASTPARQLGLQVLVAEDNEVNQKLFAEQLALLGCQARLVADGIEALAALSDTRFDAIVTDLNMPRMDGYVLASIVRERWPGTPIVAVTADATLDERRRCAALGIREVAIKPLSLSGLARVLGEISGQGASSPKDGPHDDTPLGAQPMSPELVEAFGHACARSIEVLRDAASRNDAPALLAELHSLKGALGVFRRRELARQCTDLEHRIQDEGVEGAHQALTELLDALLALPNTGEQS
ncbi:ATP-binding protein [Burkholderia gladioli]|uniref:ATP-binding protein n=1 Tax=Burkholderia gladioli TaxID=28095 RepID=UPI001640E1B1|nr:ATP-binding protein [Burkholderia gladioli]